ncbi:MAG TPA: POTRA domain-containing protein, partial [Candidatus Acidoferrum sp.]|nr:POTRA domain-containing protein [Candidatus Acidoferrum sp.]
RRIPSDAVAVQLSLHSGDRLDARKLRNDIRALGWLGWFESVRVEEVARTPDIYERPDERKHVTLIFYFEEHPILSRVEYSGSRLLSSKQIEKLLSEKKLESRIGEPANPATLKEITIAIRSALNELGHPDASIQVSPHSEKNATLRVRFQIVDGPHLPVRWVRFEGDPGVSEKLLRAQMQNIAPWKPLASLRGKDAYTRAAFEADRRRILTFYADHGYPEARVGDAQTSKFIERSWKHFPFIHSSTQNGLLLSIPVQAGPYYQFESVEPSEAMQQALAKHVKPFRLPVPEKGSAFSQQAVDNLRRYYSARLRPLRSKSNLASYPSIEANPIFDPENHSVRLRVNLSDSPPYLVYRIGFQGLHKFSDRFVRRRILLREGHPLDERVLEAGLTKLARTGYFKPIHKENVHIQLDDARHTADIVIRLEEIGQQRASLVGGQSQFGSTLGFAYTVFDLLNHEELLSSKLEGGPESLQMLLGIAKEGVFGTRSSLAFAVFDNVLRPRLTHGVRGPFITSHSMGVSVPWSYAFSQSDSLGINYTLSTTTTDEPLGTPPGLTGLPPLDLRTRVDSRAIGASWSHDTGSERVLFSDSVSGGALGGQENMVRASGEAARIFRDPFFSSDNAWAFRTTLSAAGSYRGNAPLYSRFFSGDEFVRGLREGDLGPLALTQTTTDSGTTMYSTSPVGANLIPAANAEYRIPLRNGIKAAGFFDLGSGWLLPNWLGPSRPALLAATNGVLHGSTGFELTWMVPDVQVPIHAYYAINVLRFDRILPLPDKSLLRAHNRLGAFGWGLGSLF